MKKANWKKILDRAFKNKHESESLLSLAAQELFRSKGFSEDFVGNVSASFASGDETVLWLRGCQEYTDLDLEILDKWSKGIIIEYLLRNMYLYDFTDELVEMLENERDI